MQMITCSGGNTPALTNTPGERDVILAALCVAIMLWSSRPVNQYRSCIFHGHSSPSAVVRTMTSGVEDLGQVGAVMLE